MSGRLSQINDLENKIFKEYIDIIEGREPEEIKTEEGFFDNREWLEAEADEICEERERIEKVARIDGGTIDLNR